MGSDLEVNDTQCVLVGSWFAYLIQFLLLAICVWLLWHKRNIELPKRPFQIWTMDVSKQGIGAVLGHFANIYIARLFANEVGGSSCQWYFLQFVFDSSIGVVVDIFCLSIVEKMLVQVGLSKIGDYGSSHLGPDFCIWGLQLFIWLMVIAFSKLIVFGLSWAYRDHFLQGISGMFSSLDPYPELELILVMIIFPVCLNAFALWVIDNFLKKRESPGPRGGGLGLDLGFGDGSDGIRSDLISPEDRENYFATKTRRRVSNGGETSLTQPQGSPNPNSNSTSNKNPLHTSPLNAGLSSSSSPPPLTYSKSPSQQTGSGWIPSWAEGMFKTSSSAAAASSSSSSKSTKNDDLEYSGLSTEEGRDIDDSNL